VFAKLVGFGAKGRRFCIEMKLGVWRKLFKDDVNVFEKRASAKVGGS